MDRRSVAIKALDSQPPPLGRLKLSGPQVVRGSENPDRPHALKAAEQRHATGSARVRSRTFSGVRK